MNTELDSLGFVPLIDAFNFHCDKGLSVYFISMQILLHFYELLCLNNVVKSACEMHCHRQEEQLESETKLAVLK